MSGEEEKTKWISFKNYAGEKISLGRPKNFLENLNSLYFYVNNNNLNLR